MRLHPGASVTFSCGFTGTPPPTVMWEHDGVVVSPGEGVGIITGANRTELTVSEGTEERGGMYRCTATNAVGNSSLDFTLLSKLIDTP